ncbi:MAG: pectin methylesterase [Lachnospiraceae bacterium]|nr:pectin methylesterase [Lachnospiraceae bacterium]
MTTLELHPGMSISDAASSAPEGAVLLRLAPGTYREKVFIRRDEVSITGTGSTPDDVRIEWGDHAFEIMPDGIKRGTFRSYTFFIKGNGNRLSNLTIENVSFPKSTSGQAIALFAEGDLIADSLILKSYQDTLFTGPLPEKEIEPGGFRGPTESDERIPCRQHYRSCRICGDVDFIFGSATCYFEDCDIVSLGNKQRDDHCEGKSYGYCTAASTIDGEKYGYVFEGCRFLNEGCPENSVYLGRPWRDHARTVMLNCYMDAHIAKEGFDDWGKKSAHQSVFYAEYASYGPGASKERADFVKMLTEEESTEYTRLKVLG